MKKNEVMVIETNSGSVELTPEIIRNQIAKGNTSIKDSEILNFMMLCKYRKLNPFLGEAHLIKFGDNVQQVTGIDVFTDRLNSHPDCDGFEVGIIVVDTKEKTKIIERKGTFYLPTEHLAGAYCVIHRKNWKEPLKWTVRIQDYYKTFYNKQTKKTEPMGLWKNMPAMMLTKCCLVATIRKAFSKEFGGMYAAEEFGADTKTIQDMEAIEVIPVKKEEKIEAKNEEKIIKPASKPTSKETSKEPESQYITEEQLDELKEAAKSKDEAIAKSYKPKKLFEYVVSKLADSKILEEKDETLIPKIHFDHVKNFILGAVEKKEKEWKNKNNIKEKEPVKEDKKKEKQLEFQSIDDLDGLPLPDNTQFVKPANTKEVNK